MTDRPDSIAAPSVITTIGTCQNSWSAGMTLGGLTKCYNAPSYTPSLIPPAAVIARITWAAALTDLRAARTVLRRLKACWLERYDSSQLQRVFDQSSSHWKGSYHNTTDGCWQISSSIMRSTGRRSSDLQLLEVEIGRVRDLSSTLRRRLIRDGFADSTMIDCQMACDLGL
jgi:hypothetical protein